MFTEHEIEWSDEEVERLWNFYSRTQRHSKSYFALMAGANVLKWVRRRMSLDGARILDFASGPAYLLDHIKGLRIRARYHAADFSRDSIDAALARHATTPQLAEARVLTQLPTSFEPSQFDVVFMLEAVEHLKDSHLKSSVAEIRRLLAPGGKLVITTPNQEDLDELKVFCPECGAIFHQTQHIRSWTPQTLSLFFHGEGFTLIDSAATLLGQRSLIHRAYFELRRLYERRPYPNLIAMFEKPPSDSG
jgi:2-polyprenyl-3-methyl-5-hydroxy-6-metoxy-1,4-benzoquinol methylase